jgi:hypothetical protein
MKAVKVFLLAGLLTFAFSSDAFSHDRNSGTNSIGAPLDGGLLTVLGAAGVAYFAARKKKKNNLGS